MMNEMLFQNHDSPTALVAAMCDPPIQARIFERLWKDTSLILNVQDTLGEIENTKIEPRTTQYRDPRYKPLRQSRIDT